MAIIVNTFMLERGSASDDMSWNDLIWDLGASGGCGYVVRAVGSLLMLSFSGGFCDLLKKCFTPESVLWTKQLHLAFRRYGGE